MVEGKKGSEKMGKGGTGVKGSKGFPPDPSLPADERFEKAVKYCQGDWIPKDLDLTCTGIRASGKECGDVATLYSLGEPRCPGHYLLDICSVAQIF